MKRFHWRKEDQIFRLFLNGWTVVALSNLYNCPPLDIERAIRNAIKRREGAEAERKRMAGGTR